MNASHSTLENIEIMLDIARKQKTEAPPESEKVHQICDIWINTLEAERAVLEARAETNSEVRA